MIKNECGHAYKLLDHAECLWCENCVEKKIAAILKNQPTITKRDIENCAGAIQYSVQTHEDWGYVESILKDMLDDIGVSITVDPRTVARRLAKKYNRNVLEPFHRESGKDDKVKQ